MAQHVPLISKCWIQSKSRVWGCASVHSGHPQLIVWHRRQTSCRCQSEETSWHSGISAKLLLDTQRIQYVIKFLNPIMVDFLKRNPGLKLHAHLAFDIRMLSKNLKLHPENIVGFQFPETPPWALTPVNINLDLSHTKKSETNPAYFSTSRHAKKF